MKIETSTEKISLPDFNLGNFDINFEVRFWIHALIIFVEGRE